MACKPVLPPSPSDESLKRCLQGTTRLAGPLDCHPDDAELVAALRYLQGHGPPSPPVWSVLRAAARRGDLFIVTREAGNSEERLARLQQANSTPRR